MESGTVEKVEVVITDEERLRQERMAAKPDLDQILNLHDFEVTLKNYSIVIQTLSLK